ncbi:putative leader peptide [Allostreptomyces psammosilenae]|uniref:Uncharacterized protein n=1 Tax=Allostreptomyces psammosilenae TaxID=1892865 RepID=A0A853AC54_9ACTN|nr:putative leader peptide [Allostreptomyces psammosilenae]NYI08151.1 hypothetical protein [Allostreptomyces psammosilenae]
MRSVDAPAVDAGSLLVERRHLDLCRLASAL